MFDGAEWAAQANLALHLLAALAAGLLIGIERGWRQRSEVEGARVAGVRTFTLIGTCGGLIGIVSLNLSPVLAAILLACLTIMLIGAFIRPRVGPVSRDATTMVAGFTTLCLGLLAGGGMAALALAGAAVATLILAMRQPIHGALRNLTEEELRAIARFAVIAGAVLPFLPDADYGPYGAWNPFQLWLVVVLVTGFSVAGYIANRLFGQQRGTLTTAVIGGAYSSTAVTAALASQIKAGEHGHYATGIALASAVMYCRVVALAAVLAPGLVLPLTALLAPASLVIALAAALIWRHERADEAAATRLTSKPFELLPALGFLMAVALAALLVRWAQDQFGQQGVALSLFIAGSFDVDAAIVAYSALPVDAVSTAIAALALAGTVAINMAFKAGIVFVNAGARAGRPALLALLASLLVLVLTIGLRAVSLFG
ncbi:MgtC/SapB family protein [Alteraurantiacibacter buctensis]|uniref:DUF4010 domain-containing protein n=1 Tax=Alteraurantiacibacter buctensis TaxID=1503981 RepID=A0A844Z0G7_9SPHN|nr:MgtC/SapB family protein [Alteraurantiacibacter buctensis]MXO72481.1 DUF4010 domain-containing protein [Alteraurantiacibacter buctensis]